MSVPVYWVLCVPDIMLNASVFSYAFLTITPREWSFLLDSQGCGDTQKEVKCLVQGPIMEKLVELSVRAKSLCFSLWIWEKYVLTISSFLKCQDKSKYKILPSTSSCLTKMASGEEVLLLLWVFIEHLLCTVCCSRCWGFCRESNWHLSVSGGVYTLRGWWRIMK